MAVSSGLSRDAEGNLVRSAAGCLYKLVRSPGMPMMPSLIRSNDAYPWGNTSAGPSGRFQSAGRRSYRRAARDLTTDSYTATRGASVQHTAQHTEFWEHNA